MSARVDDLGYRETGRSDAPADGSWLTLRPVPTELQPVEPCDPARLLPSAFGAWTADVAHRTQCPPDFVAVALVVAFGSVLGRGLTIRPKQYDDWAVVPNLWGLAIGPPGIMKSPALKEALRPLHRLVAEERKRYSASRRRRDYQMLEASIRRKLLEKKIEEAIKAGTPTDALQEAFTQATLEGDPRERRFIVNDVTVEALGTLLQHAPTGLLFFRDELFGLLRTMEREGHENDRAFLNECWNGNGAPYTYDRIQRGSIVVEACCLAVLGGIQPDPLGTYLRETFAGGQDDGLIQRFQLLVYPDVPGSFQYVDRWPDSETRQQVAARFRWAAEFDAVAVGARQDHDDDLPYLHFALDAQARFIDWYTRHQTQGRTAPAHAILQTHFAKYPKLVPALALLFHTLDCAEFGRGGPVSLPALEQALAWVPYLESHAHRVYESVTERTRIAAARLAAHMQAGTLTDPFTVRAVQRRGWSGLSDGRDVLDALSALEDLHWVRPRRLPSGPGGGRPRVVYALHPTLPRAKQE
jgi:Protein of unknown function (DUF3987)